MFFPSFLKVIEDTDVSTLSLMECLEQIAYLACPPTSVHQLPAARPCPAGALRRASACASARRAVEKAV